MSAVRDHAALHALAATNAIRMGDLKCIEHADTPPLELPNEKKAELAARKDKRAPKHDEMFVSVAASASV